MKKILYHLFNMMGYAMGSVLAAWICFYGINMTIKAWQRPWSGFDYILVPIYGLIYGGLSIFIGCFSIICFIGIFKAKAWSEIPKKEEKKISQVRKYQNFGNKMIYKPKENRYDNTRSYFCFFELDDSRNFVLVHTDIFHLNKFNDEIIDETEIVVEETDYNDTPWGSHYFGFHKWYEIHNEKEFDPFVHYRRRNLDPDEFFFDEKGQVKVIVDFYNEYIKNDKHAKTDLIEVS
jgi:hypothetical protein